MEFMLRAAILFYKSALGTDDGLAAELYTTTDYLSICYTNEPVISPQKTAQQRLTVLMQIVGNGLPSCIRPYESAFHLTTRLSTFLRLVESD